MKNCVHTRGDYLFLDIKAVPGASKSALGEIIEGRLKVRIAAAPEDGKANAELLNFLSKTLDCPKRDLRLLSGEKSRLKAVALPLECRAKLEGVIACFHQ